MISQLLFTAIAHKPGLSNMPSEPEWTKAALSQTHKEFKAARIEIQRVYGLIPEGALLKPAVGEAALKVYDRTHDPVDAFKAIYLTIATDTPSAYFEPDKKWNALWNVLPRDDYEVARLHLIWCIPHVDLLLKPLGQRLLAIDGKDAELLWRLAHHYSHFGPKSDEVIGIELAERSAKLAPGPRTYLECADARASILWYRKNGGDAELCLKWLAKYFASAAKNDPGQAFAKKCHDIIVNHRY